MKKGLKILSALFVAATATVVFAASGFAQDFSCSAMEVVKTSTTSAWLKNVSGAACGSLGNTKQRYFLLSPTDKDAQLAILLTAVSLNKTLWIHSPADIGNGDTVDVVSLSN